MKQLILFFLLLTATGSMAQQVLIPRISMDMGAGVQEHKFRNAYGFGVQFETPLKSSPFRFTAGIDYSINGIRSLPYTFRFGGSLANADVIYTSAIWKATTGMIVSPVSDNRILPFLGIHAGGILYNTRSRIEMRDFFDDCRPIDSRNEKADIAFIGRGEAGLRYRLGQSRNGPSFISISAAYTKGTRAEYIRMSNEHVHDPKAKEYNIRFRNERTGEIHDHSLGSIYNTRTSQVSFLVGVAFPL